MNICKCLLKLRETIDRFYPKRYFYNLPKQENQFIKILVHHSFKSLEVNVSSVK